MLKARIQVLSHCIRMGPKGIEKVIIRDGKRCTGHREEGHVQTEVAVIQLNYKPGVAWDHQKEERDAKIIPWESQREHGPGDTLALNIEHLEL